MKFIIINKGKGLIDDLSPINLLQLEKTPSLEEVTSAVGNNETTKPIIANELTVKALNGVKGTLRINPTTSEIEFLGDFGALALAIPTLSNQLKLYNNFDNERKLLLDYDQITGEKIATFQNKSIIVAGLEDIIAAVGNYQLLSQKGQPGGYIPSNNNNKIDSAYLPDSIFGQLVFGGTFNATTNLASLSNNAKNKLNTEENVITLTNDSSPITGVADNEGLFYIVTSPGTFYGIKLSVGDWLFSIGYSWQKVDNSDAISLFNGRTGNIVLNYQDILDALGFTPADANLINNFLSKDGGNADQDVNIGSQKFFANELNVGNGRLAVEGDISKIEAGNSIVLNKDDNSTTHNIKGSERTVSELYPLGIRYFSGRVLYNGDFTGQNNGTVQIIDDDSREVNYYANRLRLNDVDVATLNDLLNLLDGVSSDANTFQKLRNLIISHTAGDYVDDIVARDAYDITHLPFTLFVRNDGDGKWAKYEATTLGTNANYVKISDPDLLNAVLSNTQIEAAYESLPNTNKFTNTYKNFIDSIPNLLNGKQAALTDPVLGQLIANITQFKTTFSGNEVFLISDGGVAKRLYLSSLYASLYNLFVKRGTTNTTTVALSLTYLNSNYSTEGTGFKVYCPMITLGAMTYEKTSTGAWLQTACLVVT